MGKRIAVVVIVLAVISAIVFWLPGRLRIDGLDSVRFGAVLPLSGDIAEYGNRCKAGMDLAVSEINASGGIRGKKLEIIYEDSEANPKDAVTALQKLISADGVSIVVGSVDSSSTLAMEPVATKNRVILFSPASSSPKLTNISRYFFRDWPSDVLEATELASFTRQELHLGRVAVLYVNNDYGLGLKNEFVRRFTELGGTVPAIESYEQAARDMRNQLAKIKDVDVDAVYLAGYHREMAFATKQIRELGLKAQILGDADYGVQELLGIAGGAAEGAIFSIPEYEPNSGSNAVRRFANAFRAAQHSKEPSDPTIFEANGYDAIRILADAVSSAGMDADKISDHISGIENYEGASGRISFGRNREVTKPVSIKMVRKGRFVPYGEGMQNRN